MSKNIDQIFTSNPITTNAATDLMYFGQSPYMSGDDAAMLFSDFLAQLPTGSGTVNSGLINNIAFYASAGTAVSGLSTTANSILAANGGAVPAFTQALPAAVQVSVNSLDSGTGASSSTFFCGNNTWSTVPTGNSSVGIDSGTSTDYVITNTPPITGFVPDGYIISFVSTNTNTTTTPTATVDGLGPYNIIVGHDILSIGLGDMPVTNMCNLQWSASASSFILINPYISAPLSPDIYAGTNYWFSGDTGMVNAYVVTPALSTYYPGLDLDPAFIIMESIQHTNTGASTISVNNDAGTPIPIITSDLQPLVGGELVQTRTAFLVFNNALVSYILLNPALDSYIVTAPQPSSAPTLALGTAYQNVLGYDAVLTVYVEVDAATAADILLGVDSTNAPTQQTIVSGLTVAATSIVPVTIYLPNNYYALLSTSGTITASISGQIAMPV